jgi:hypothetical protein
MYFCALLVGRTRIRRKNDPVALQAEEWEQVAPKGSAPFEGVSKPLDVDDVVAGIRDEAGHAFRPERSCHAGRKAAPIVAGQNGALNPESVEEIDQITAERSLLPAAHRRWEKKARRTEAAQVGNDHACARCRQTWRDLVIGVDVVRETMREDDGQPLAGPSSRRAISKTLVRTVFRFDILSPNQSRESAR